LFGPSVSSSLVLTTIPASTTSTVVVSSPTIVAAPVTYSIQVTVNAPGAGTATGVYNVLANNVVICPNLALSGGTGNCTQTYNSLQTVSITVVYTGSVNFLTSTSAITSVLIAPAPTNTTVSSSVNPAVTNQPVTLFATVSVLPPSLTGASNVTGVIPTGTVSFSVSDPNCQSRGLALNALISPTTYQATCTTTFGTAGPRTITATFTPFTGGTAAGSTGTITQTILGGAVITFGPSTPPPVTTANNGTNTTTAVSTTSSGNATTPVGSTGQLYLVIINFGYCPTNTQWLTYLQNLANALAIATNSIVVVTSPTGTCVAAKRQTAQKSTAVVGFYDLATAQNAVNLINNGGVQGIPGFPNPTAVLASGATSGGGLSGGQIAGIVVGSVLGFILIVALIVIAFILGRKQGGGSEMSGRA